MAKLTAKQEAFCLSYIETGNASEAYRTAYDAENCKPETIHNKACILLKNHKVVAKVEEIKEVKAKAYRDLCTIDIERDVMDKVLALFDTPQDASRWATDIVKYKALELGVDTLKRSRHIESNSRYSVMHEAGFKCQCCGAKSAKDNEVTLHIDHIIPFSIGGSNHPSNLQCLCSECNFSKKDRYAFNHKLENQDV